MGLRRAIATMLDVRPEEERLVWLLMLHSFCIGVPRNLTSTAGMALFLSHSDARHLPWVYIAAAIAIPVTGFLRLRLSARVGLRTLLAVDLLVVLVTLLTLRGALGMGHVVPVALVLPVWAEVEGVLLTLEFWGLSGSLLNVRQGKRLFGPIGAGELAAGALTGLLVPLFVARFGTADLLWVSAAAVVGCLALLRVVTRRFPLLEAAGGEEDRSHAARSGGGLRSGYLRLLFALVALSYVAYYFLDNAFYALAAARYPAERDLTAFIGVFNGSVAAITLLARALAGRALARFGLGALQFMPAAIGLGCLGVVGAGALAAPTALLFALLALTKLVDQSLRDSIDRSAVLLLYQPLPGAARVRAQTAVEGIVGPLAGGVAGIALLALVGGLGFGAVELCALLGLLVLGWVVVAATLRGAYTEKLRRALESRHLQGVSLALDASSLAVLQKGLHSPRPEEVAYCLGVLEELGHPSLESAVVAQLGHQDPAVRRDASLRVERLGLRAALGAVRLAAVAEEDAAARGAALRALAAIGEPEDVERVMLSLDAPEVEARCGALVALLRHGGIEGVLAAGERLVTMARAEEPVAREEAARVIGEVGQASFYRPLIALLADREPAVRRAALWAAGRLRNPRLLPLLLRSLDLPAHRSAAMAALVASGPAVLPDLEQAFHAADEQRRRSAQRRVARLIGQIGGARAREFLWLCADHDDPEVRLSLLSSLATTGFEAAPAAVPQVKERIAREVRDAVVVLAMLEDVRAEARGSLLASTLDHAFGRARERVFCLLGFVYPPDPVLRARVNLSSRRPEKRAQAVELVDSLVTPDVGKLVVPLLEDVAHAERLRKLGATFPHQLLGFAARLERLVTDEATAPWLRACALQAAVEADLPGLLALAPRVPADETIVREVLTRLPRRRQPATGLALDEAERLIARYEAELSGGTSMLTTVEKVIILKSVSIFRETPDEILAEVASRLEEVDVGPGGIVFEKGDMGSALYIVVEGGVRVVNEGRVLRELGPREIFGEMAALDPEPRSASVLAIGATHLFRLEQEALYELMADRIEVVRGVIRVLCERLRTVTS
ncbi:MAG: cyclic nucleotide-binding domain-containing protein [Vicinamibacteria bacterium]|jgi:HEAT repeat protein|nr:cyclic nucleotide-binding domain-containing protein [Vicinamibacteria bacterium]MCL4821392.1 cyclic nucleotide-binding domain-containing protein [Vicinamibacteria bacterium]